MSEEKFEYEISLGEKVFRLREALGLPNCDPHHGTWLPLDEMLDMAIGDAHRVMTKHREVEIDLEGAEERIAELEAQLAERERLARQLYEALEGLNLATVLVTLPEEYRDTFRPAYFKAEAAISAFEDAVWEFKPDGE